MPTCGGRCTPNVWEHGKTCMMVVGPRASTIEDWVVQLRTATRLTEHELDWSFAGGYAYVAFVGDHEILARIHNAARQLVGDLRRAYREAPDNHSSPPYLDEDVTVRLQDQDGVRTYL